jgi:hypothetical protein
MNRSDEDRRRELEAEMERHKARFMAASQQGLDAFKRDLSIVNWVGTYPVPAAMLAFLGGICLGFASSSSSSKRLDPSKTYSLR